MDELTYEQVQALKQERINKFKSIYAGKVATSEDATKKTDAKFVNKNTRTYTKEEIISIVSQGDPIQRAELSEFFFQTNGLYKRIIVHYATFLTYSWILVPYLKKREYDITEKKNAIVYYNAADFCTNFQIERKCALFAKDVLIKGAYYGLIRDEGDNLIIQDLPFEYCRSRFKNNQDVDLVEFD